MNNVWIIFVNLDGQSTVMKICGSLEVAKEYMYIYETNSKGRDEFYIKRMPVFNEVG